jgi:TadE-like protein
MRPTLIGERLRRDRESGQATTEFALILIPLLIMVGGIIFFGIGLNYWLDMNRVANQGARFAAVNNWPAQCPRPASTPASPSTYCDDVYPTCNSTLAVGSTAKLQEVLRCSARNNPLVRVCYPGKDDSTVTAGDPVKVTLTAPYKFFFFNSFRVMLTASATMRLEQRPTFITSNPPSGGCS